MSRDAEIERSFEPGLTEWWFAVWTFPAQERHVFRALADLDLGAYLPMRGEVAIVRGRKVIVETPLFPGFCFVRLAQWLPRHWRQALEVPGVGGILLDGGAPARIPDMQLANPMYADVLAWLKRERPREQIFLSNRQKKRELAIKRHLAKIAA